jgi:hypothetical protein
LVVKKALNTVTAWSPSFSPGSEQHAKNCQANATYSERTPS